MPRKTRRRSSIRRKRVTKKSRVGGWNLFKTTEDKINEEFKSSEGDIEAYPKLCKYYINNNTKDFLSASADLKTKCIDIGNKEKAITEIKENIKKVHQFIDEDYDQKIGSMDQFITTLYLLCGYDCSVNTFLGETHRTPNWRESDLPLIHCFKEMY